MKVISLLEPYASLIKNNVKRIETRSWKTKYRGELYIHASKKELTRKQLLENKEPLNLIEDKSFKYGYIIAKCKLVDCVLMDKKFLEVIRSNNTEYICGQYEIGRYAWIIEDIQMLSNPIKVNGQLGIWNYNIEMEK